MTQTIQKIGVRKAPGSGNKNPNFFPTINGKRVCHYSMRRDLALAMAQRLAGFDPDKRRGNSAMIGHGVNSQAMMEARRNAHLRTSAKSADQPEHASGENGCAEDCHACEIERNSRTMGFHDLSDEEWDALTEEQQAKLHTEAGTPRRRMGKSATLELCSRGVLESALDTLDGFKCEDLKFYTREFKKINRQIAGLEAVEMASQNLLEMFVESHQAEIDSNHGGDGKRGCSYCKAIKAMRRALASCGVLPA